MNRTKVIIILPSLAGGGAEKVLISFVENLNIKTFNPILILLNNYGPLNPKIPDSNIINLSNLRLRYSLIKLFRELKNLKPDIVLSTFPHISVVLLLFKKLFLKDLRIIVREPNMVNLSLSHSPFSKIMKMLHKYLMPLADHIIVTSKAMEDDFIRRGILNSKISLIYNPIDKNRIRKIDNMIRYPGEGLRLVTVGRLVFQKGLDRIIPIIKKINNCHLTIIGEGPCKKDLEEQIKQFGLNTKVKFTGYIKNYNSYVAAADYFLLPSRWEGLPNAALESLMLGTPVYSFKEVEGLKDIIVSVPKEKLILFTDELGMQKKLMNSIPRSDWKTPILRNSLLTKFNTPISYATKIEKIIKGQLFD